MLKNLFLISIISFISVVSLKAIQSASSNSFDYEEKMDILKFLAENIRFVKGSNRIRSLQPKSDFRLIVKI